MGKRRISATGETNVSSPLEKALRQLIGHRLERRWLAGHDASLDQPTPTYDLRHIPWEDADAQG